MKPRRTFSFLAGMALLGAIATYIEITRTTAQPSDRVGQPADRVAKPAEINNTARVAALPPAQAPIESAAPPGNPLWVLPLKQLSTTRDRPIFSPSRRPPPPATPSYVAPVSVRQPAKPVEPERPAVTLLGTVVGEVDQLGVGVFKESATGTVIKMRTGEDHQGWVLRSVKSREVTLTKDREKVTLELPAPGGDSPMMPGGLTPGMPVPGMRVPGMAVPGVQVPGVQVPGMAAPGAQVPGMAAPGAQASGAQVPGVQAPGVQAPGVQAPRRQPRR
ncbi:MAG TPA: hypothetical protein VKP67_28425 [Xanthobacteraceae bacterium]|nr:hypothetical protein [Xanthobacteraceae bacterium]